MGMVDRKLDRLTDELKSARAELKNIASLVADLLQGEEQRKKMATDLEHVKELANKLQEDMTTQHDLIMSLATAISGSSLGQVVHSVRG